MRIKKPFCIILTGAPGTGKTTVLEELKKRGQQVFTEPAREILRHQIKIDGPALPAKNAKLFVEEMLKLSVRQFESAMVGPAFFDRAIPDTVVYAQRFGVDGKDFEAAAENYRYNPEVFIFAPWKEIFVNDEVRGLSYEMAEQVHELQSVNYRRLGYELVDVPRGNPNFRADFILNFLTH